MPSKIHGWDAGHKSRRGFTLVELMVVAAITSILTALLLPALSSAKEKSRRAVCKSNMRQFAYACHLYGADNNDYLPSSTDNHGHVQTIYVSDYTYTNLLDYCGDAAVLSCPNIVLGDEPAHDKTRGYTIGYNYVGGLDTESMSSSQNSKLLPLKLTASSTNIILADANYWVPTGTMLKIAPHCKSGARMQNKSSFTYGLNGTQSSEIGASGGNVALLNLSISWKPIEAMQTYEASYGVSTTETSFGSW